MTVTDTTANVDADIETPVDSPAPVEPAVEPRRASVMIVHAHPDDEVFAGGATLARYADAGAHTVLVTATNGECGELYAPELDPERDKPRLGEIRLAELRESVAAFGIGALELLGYRDSGMWEWADNGHPDCFNQADISQAVGRMVRLIRAHRPDVIATYNVDGGYAHPDHLMTHSVTALAFQAAADPTRYVDAGAPWAASKLYAIAWSRSDFHRLWWAMKERGLKWPWGEEDTPPDWGSPDEVITARVDVSPYRDRVRAAFAAHRSQLKPDSVWNNLPPDLADMRHRYESYTLLRSRVKVEAQETDLLAGVEGLIALAAAAAD